MSLQQSLLCLWLFKHSVHVTIDLTFGDPDNSLYEILSLGQSLYLQPSVSPPVLCCSGLTNLGKVHEADHQRRAKSNFDCFDLLSTMALSSPNNNCMAP